MKILLTADPFLPVPPTGYGGIERIVDGLARELTALGHEVALVAHPDSTCPVAMLYAWPAFNTSSRADLVKNTFHLFRAAASFRPDVIHSFSRLAFLLPLLPLSVPKIMSYQRHTGPGQTAWAHRLSRGTLTFTACSEFIARMGRTEDNPWRVIHNFVDCDRYPFAPDAGPDAPLVFLSRIESIKGAHLAIDIARASGRKLILAGNRIDSGPEKSYWDNRIAPQIDGRQVEYVGEVNDSEKAVLLGRAAAMLVPIQWDEPFGIVFAEALACGTPVISCPRGALPEIVRDGINGYLITNVEEGVRAVAGLPGISREACRRDAEERFSQKTRGAAYAELYGELTDARRS